MKLLRVTKITIEVKFKKVWGKLEAKKLFSETHIHRIFETTSSFHVKSWATGKVQFFLKECFASIDNFHFGRILDTRLSFYEV